jgi:hypothetical protein
VVLVGCTPQQVQDWVAWHDQSPVEAEAFANLPAIQDALHPAPAVAMHGHKWAAIAYCESGGRWDYPPVSNRTGTYSGGLMIWQKAWLTYGGQEFADWAYQATEAEQIVVAERILADQGWGAWDCA